MHDERTTMEARAAMERDLPTPSRTADGTANRPPRLRRRIIAMILASSFVLLVWLLGWNKEWCSPEIDGVLELDREERIPVAGAIVVVINARGVRQSVVSDARGRFRFAATQCDAWGPFFGDRCYTTEVHIEHARFKTVLWSSFNCGGELSTSYPPTVEFLRIVMIPTESPIDPEIDHHHAGWQYREAYDGRAGGDKLPDWVKELDQARLAVEPPK